MHTKRLLPFAIIASLLASPARADSAPIERFAHSLVLVYVAAEKCKDVNTLHSENYVMLIRNYLHSYFQPEIPYWVLPIVQERLKSRENCVFAIEQGLVRYQKESVAYALNYPDRPIPPALEEYMLVDGRNYGAQTDINDSASSHHLTPSVVVK